MKNKNLFTFLIYILHTHYFEQYEPNWNVIICLTPISDFNYLFVFCLKINWVHIYIGNHMTQPAPTPTSLACDMWWLSWNSHRSLYCPGPFPVLGNPCLVLCWSHPSPKSLPSSWIRQKLNICCQMSGTGLDQAGKWDRTKMGLGTMGIRAPEILTLSHIVHPKIEILKVFPIIEAMRLMQKRGFGSGSALQVSEWGAVMAGV